MSKAKIVSDPRILGGKPVIKGTRISVELIMNFLSAGMSINDILVEYPELKKDEIQLAVDYANKLVKKVRTKEDDSQISIILHEITGR